MDHYDISIDDPYDPCVGEEDYITDEELARADFYYWADEVKTALRDVDDAQQFLGGALLAMSRGLRAAKRAYEELYPYTRHGKGKGTRKRGTPMAPKFTIAMAARVGCSVSTIQKYLQLEKLPPEIREWLHTRPEISSVLRLLVAMTNKANAPNIPAAMRAYEETSDLEAFRRALYGAERSDALLLSAGDGPEAEDPPPSEGLVSPVSSSLIETPAETIVRLVSAAHVDEWASIEVLIKDAHGHVLARQELDRS